MRVVCVSHILGQVWQAVPKEGLCLCLNFQEPAWFVHFQACLKSFRWAPLKQQNPSNPSIFAILIQSNGNGCLMIHLWCKSNTNVNLWCIFKEWQEKACLIDRCCFLLCDCSFRHWFSGGSFCSASLCCLYLYTLVSTVFRFVFSLDCLKEDL